MKIWMKEECRESFKKAKEKWEIKIRINSAIKMPPLLLPDHLNRVYLIDFHLDILFSAEREGFEPPETCASTVFKTAAFDRSAISPAQK